MTRGAELDTVIPWERRHAAVPYAALVLLLAVGSIATVWIFQAAGYAPCELCLKERLPYDAGIGLAALTLVVAWRGPRWAARLGFVVLILLFLFSAGFGVYHAGVEWGWWAGPSGCTGTLGDRAASSADFMRQLQSVQIVRCDAVAIRILGLSLAGWNAVASLVIAGLAAAGFRRS